MAKVRPFNPIRGLCDFEDEEGAIDNDGLQSGLAQREKMKPRGGVTKVRLGKDEYGDNHREHTNQDQGSSF